jgi:ketosteroid isomerase-like protein
MSQKNIDLAVAYYEAMDRKDLSCIEKHLHPEVVMVGPMATLEGKEAVFESVKNFTNFFKSLTIRAKCEGKDHIMLAYDLDCPAPIGLFRGAVLLTFQDGLIIGYELFYDARAFEKKKDEIFS